MQLDFKHCFSISKRSDLCWHYWSTPEIRTQNLILPLPLFPFRTKSAWGGGVHFTGEHLWHRCISVWIYRNWVLTNRRIALEISPCKHTIFLVSFSMSFFFCACRASLFKFRQMYRAEWFFGDLNVYLLLILWYSDITA